MTGDKWTKIMYTGSFSSFHNKARALHKRANENPLKVSSDIPQNSIVF